MFTEAVAIAEEFTGPLIRMLRTHAGTVKAKVGTFVHVNDEGWIVTSAHLVETILTKEGHKEKIREYDRKLEELNRSGLSKTELEKAVLQLEYDPDWIALHKVAFSYRDDLRLVDCRVFKNQDIAIGRLEGFDPAMVTNYPEFMPATTRIERGRSVCKLGYPWPSGQVDFDPETGGFKLDTNLVPFPLEGSLTRIIVEYDDHGTQVRFLETSTPGIKGQSGGPVFDTDARIWGIQTKIVAMPLDVAGQFMTVGLATHVLEILPLFDSIGVGYAVAP